MNKAAPKYIKYIILALLLYMPVFGHLDTLPIRIWDEARVAMNAYEMFNNNDFIVTQFNGKPDMWNTKPPLLIWFQVICMKAIGVNELAVRLPSAIAAFFTCCALLIFSLYYLRNFWFGFITVLVLITSWGYINLHASRTGDYDAMLTLFTTLSGLFFFTYCETKKHKHLYMFFAVTALAVLTKSITGLLFIPALIIYSIIQRQFIALLRNKHFYIGLLSTVAVIAGYYILREINNPGYLAAVQENELGGRYLDVVEDHTSGFWFYYNNFLDMKLSAWHFIIPYGLIVGLIGNNKKIRKITLFSSLMILTFFVIISTAQTKLEWYDVPLYPFLAILTAVFIHYIFKLLRESNWIKQKIIIKTISFIFLFLVFLIPYQKIFDKTYKPKETIEGKDFYEISYYLKDAIIGKNNLDGQYLLYDGYGVHNLFYLKILNDQGIQISFKYWKNLQKEDIVIAQQENVKLYLEENYTLEKMNTKGNVITYKIHGRKPQI